MSRKNKITLSSLWQRVDFTDKSTLALIFSNLLVIFFAVVDKISATEILWIYWFQSVTIGIFNFIRMITLKNFSTEGFKQGGKQVLPTRGAAISSGVFFLFHYGFFHLIYAIFLGVLPLTTGVNSANGSMKYVLISALVFFLNYLFDYIKTVREPSDELPNLGKIMFAPYARIIPMHLTIILGGFITAGGSAFSVNVDIVLISLLTGIKTIVDLITHSINFETVKKLSEPAAD